MWLQHGHCRQYRNYTNLTLDWVPHQNVFLGSNAAGKTNILEAIYFLSHGKSHRTRHDRELIQKGHSFATIQAVAASHRHGGDLSLECQLTLTSTGMLKTIFKLNGQPVKSRSEIVGKIPTVGFFLSDLLMLRGAPEDRRNALDSALVQYDPTHFKRLHTYQRVRQQKSQWLKRLHEHQDGMVLASLNQQLAEAGTQVMMARIQYLQALETIAQLRHLELASSELLQFFYQPSFSIERSQLHPQAIQQAFLQAIESHEREERRRQQVLVGPHRDDIRFVLDEMDAVHYGSQGQQRSIVLAFKLAEIALLEQQLDHETPILLMDDVMAELDPTRQESLLRYLNPAMQVFVTTTHLTGALEAYLQTHQTARIFNVDHGTVTCSEQSVGS